MGGIVDLDIEDVKQGLASGTIVLVDVREPHEFEAGHIPGAISMPLSQFRPEDLPVEGGRQVVLACAAGVRSVQGIMRAQAAGIDVDTHYRGGFRDWMMRGEPVETGR